MWFVAGCLVGLSLVPLVAQTIRSNATQFPSVRIETNGSEGAPSLSFLNATTKGLFRLDANSVGLSGHFVPGASATYDLGSASNKFRNLYTSGTVNQLVGLFGNGNAGSPSISFASAPTKGFYLFDAMTVGLSGNLFASADDTYDIGSVADRRFANAFFTQLVMANQVQVGAGPPDATNLLLWLDHDGGFLSTPYLGIVGADGVNYAGLVSRIVDTEAVQFDPTYYGDAQPTCSSDVRGTMWYVYGATGVADQLQVCGKSAANDYAWVTLQ